MKRIFSVERPGPVLFLLGVGLVVLILTGCMKNEDAVVYTGAITNITLVTQSGDAPESLPTLEDEVTGTDTSSSSSGTPILSGPPGDAPGAPPTSPGDAPTPPAANPPDDPRVSREDADNCSSVIGVDSHHIRVVHVGQTIQWSSSSPLALKVTGNRPVVTLNLRGAEDSSLPGLCLFVMGNQSRLTVNVGVTLGGLAYKGRGNQSYSQIQFDPAGSLVKSFLADLAGNQASLIVSGAGKHICPAAASLHGNSPSISCTPN